MALAHNSAQQLFKFMFDDFESAWEALVARPGKHKGGGNFMFAMLSMVLLEFTGRLCAPDNSKLQHLYVVLNRIEPRYFTRLPGPCSAKLSFLPGPSPSQSLLGMLFDLIRNGKVHQYQSPILALGDGDLDIAISGAATHRSLRKTGRKRSRRHLTTRRKGQRVLLYFHPDQFFLDLKKAILDSGVGNNQLAVEHIKRVRSPGNYDYSLADFENAMGATRPT